MMTEDDKAQIGKMIAEASAKEQEVIRQLVKVATEEAINETFKVLGLDVNDFEHVKEFRENHSWVKRYRKLSESVGSRIIVTITAVLTTGVLAAIWAYIQSRGN